VSSEFNRSEAQARKWWRFRFSLRTLLILTTVFSVWLGLNLNRAKIQRTSIKVLTERAPQAQNIGYDFQYLEQGGMNPTLGPGAPAWLLRILGTDFFYRVVFVNLNGAAASVPRLQYLRGLPDLRYLGLDNGVVTTDVAEAISVMKDLEILSLQMCHISAEQIRPFKRLGKLQKLYLTFNTIGDGGLKYVGDLQSLRELQLQDTDITDDGLKYLARLTNLEELYLSGNERLTNAGLKHLRPLTKLKKLSLWKDREISDEGLAALRELPSLKALDVSGTAVSKAAAAEFEKTMPGLKVSR
jgi:Leucine-rich repeat (LRR) protein